MSGALQHAARVLKQGGIVAYATEYCFGLGCDPRNRAAVLQLLQIKRRHVSKGLIVLAADVEQLVPYSEKFPTNVLKSWPGPHTWLLDACATVPRWITGRHSRIALRVTAHAQAAALCRAAGFAIVSTSANRSGEAPARSHRDVLHRLGSAVDYVLPGHVGDLERPTPIRDAASGEILRA